MILTMIPGIDQLADVQDIVNILYRLIWKQEWDVKMHWVLLVITLIGLIPVLGSLAKGVLKLLIKKAGDIPNKKVVDGRQIGRTQAEYNQVTHFRIEK